MQSKLDTLSMVFVLSVFYSKVEWSGLRIYMTKIKKLKECCGKKSEILTPYKDGSPEALQYSREINGL